MFGGREPVDLQNVYFARRVYRLFDSRSNGSRFSRHATSLLEYTANSNSNS